MWGRRSHHSSDNSPYATYLKTLIRLLDNRNRKRLHLSRNVCKIQEHHASLVCSTLLIGNRAELKVRVTNLTTAGQRVTVKVVSNGTLTIGRSWKKEEEVWIGITSGNDSVWLGWVRKSQVRLGLVRGSRGDLATPLSDKGFSKKARGEIRDSDVKKLTVVWSHLVRKFQLTGTSS